MLIFVPNSFYWCVCVCVCARVDCGHFDGQWGHGGRHVIRIYRLIAEQKLARARQPKLNASQRSTKETQSNPIRPRKASQRRPDRVSLVPREDKGQSRKTPMKNPSILPSSAQLWRSFDSINRAEKKKSTLCASSDSFGRFQCCKR